MGRRNGYRFMIGGFWICLEERREVKRLDMIFGNGVGCVPFDVIFAFGWYFG